MSIPRVASLLRNPVETASFSDWQALVAASTPEAFDLDFKKEHYSTKNPNVERSFATDIAAFANTQGGVIVIGVDEENRLATSIAPISFDEDLEQRMERWVANNVFPRPVWQSHRVPDPMDNDQGLLLCIVPRSRLAPHAVHTDNNPTLRYPIRRNADNFFLAEHEVAERYRQRFVTGRESEERAATVMRQGGEGRQGSRTRPAIELSLVPLDPGDLRLTLTLQRERRMRLSSLRPRHCWAGADVHTAFRQLRYRDRRQEPNLYAELHTDGASYGMAALGVRPVGQLNRLFAGHLVCVTKEILDQTTHHAVQAGCIGDALLTARLDIPSSLLSSIRLPLPGDESPWSWDTLSQPSGHLTSQQTVTILRSERETMCVVSAVLTDWYQCFGIPEIDLIDADGRIETGRWSVIMQHPDVTFHDRGSLPPEVFRP